MRVFDSNSIRGLVAFQLLVVRGEVDMSERCVCEIALLMIVYM